MQTGVKVWLPVVMGSLLVVATSGWADVLASREPGHQLEVDLAVDPTNPRHLVGASYLFQKVPPLAEASDATKWLYGLLSYESENGGLSWTSTPLPLPADPRLTKAGDPAVAFDRHGVAYSAFYAANLAETQVQIMVSHRVPGAAAWSTPVRVSSTNAFADKEFLAVDVDPDSPCADSIYVGWSDLKIGGVRQPTLRVARSSNGGASFSEPVRVNARALDDLSETHLGAYPLVGPAGHLYMLWNDWELKTIRFARSLDCGATWAPDTRVQPWTMPDTGDTIRYRGCPSNPHRGVSPLVAAAVDTSDGPYRGRIYAAYTDLGVPTAGVDVYLTFSSDEGATWSPPVVVNDDAPTAANDQYLPRVTVDPGDSSVHVIFYDSRDDPAHKKVAVYEAVSLNGGQTWTNRRISTGTADMSGASPAGYGEYIGLAAAPGSVFALWAANPTGGDLDAWAANLPGRLAVATPSLPNAVVGVAYAVPLLEGGGVGPYSWSVSSLPSSLTLDGGVISGTAASSDVGTYPLDVTVADSDGGVASKRLSLTVTEPPPVITTAELPGTYAGRAYEFQVEAAGGAPPYAWTFSGLPASLTGTPAGLLTGTPTSADIGPWLVRATVTDSRGVRASRSWRWLQVGPELQVPTTLVPKMSGCGCSGGDMSLVSTLVVLCGLGVRRRRASRC